MAFHFVDQSDINSNKERKLIRSHVMKGKNVGKKRQKRVQQSESTANKSVVLHQMGVGNESTSTMTLERSQCNDTSILAVTRQIANDLSLLPSTRGIPPETMVHIRQMSSYILDISSPREFCQSTGVTESIWFRLAFYNRAYFHCTVAIASACAAFLTEDSYRSPVALCHMSEAYRLVNKTLSSDELLSDDTVAVVAAINIYDRLHGDPQKAMVHLNGLTSLITLRGGISELAGRNIVVAEKAFRCDVELALSCGTAPKFSSKHVPRHLVLVDSRGCLEPCKQGEAEAGESVQCTLLYVGYRLLEIKPSRYGSGADASFDLLVQLALTGFQNTFCFGIGRKIMTFPLLMERFRSVAQTVRGTNRPQQMIIVWALLMGRVSALTRDDDFWLVPKLKTLANELGLRSWSEVSNALCQFPWVKATHEAPGEEFWNAKLAHAAPLQPAIVK